MEKGDDRPIGVFDSGIGGLTVLKEIWSILPGEKTVYFGDSGRMPYGSKSHETIVDFSRQITRFLLAQKIKLLVIACNSASAHAYEAVRALCPVPVIEVVSPGARKAIDETENGKIGVIATRATVASGVYKNALMKSRRDAKKSTVLDDLQIFQKACPLFVPLAEEGWWEHPVTRLVIEEYFSELIAAQIDTLVLGCTHYPLLKNMIRSVVGEDIRLIDAGERVAREVADVLIDFGLKNNSGKEPEKLFFTSDAPFLFEKHAASFLGGGQVHGTKRIPIERYGKELI